MLLSSRFVAALLALALLGVLGLAGPVGVARAEPPVFDHDLTRFPLLGVHERTDCETCHVGGRFTGTPTRCAACHDGTTKWAITAKSPLHVPTTAACDDCHRTWSWLPARMDHGVVTDRCETCHNGVSAEGKGPNHIQTTSTCSACHNTISWRGANRFDHSGISSGCFTCHNGVTATGKHPGHIASSNDCELCHSTRRWVPAGFDHAGITSGCSTCHNGGDATGKGSGHFMTSSDCNECHMTSRWIPASYAHMGAYPGDHRRNLACTDCHGGNSPAVTWSMPAFQPDCGGCHANDFERGPHKKYENPDTFYSVSELRDCSGSCHFYTDATLTTIKELRNGEHRVSDSNFD